MVGGLDTVDRDPHQSAWSILLARTRSQPILRHTHNAHRPRHRFVDAAVSRQFDRSPCGCDGLSTAVMRLPVCTTQGLGKPASRSLGLAGPPRGVVRAQLFRTRRQPRLPLPQTPHRQAALRLRRRAEVVVPVPPAAAVAGQSPPTCISEVSIALQLLSFCPGLLVEQARAQHCRLWPTPVSAVDCRQRAVRLRNMRYIGVVPYLAAERRAW